MFNGNSKSIPGVVPNLPSWGSGTSTGSDMSSWGVGAGVGTLGSPISIDVSGGSAPVSVPATLPAAQMGTSLGFNMPTANLALSGLSTIGNLWAAFQAQKLARQQFKYTKNVTDTNLANQIKSYNTTLADRSYSRAKVEGRDDASAQSYIDSNSLRRYGT